ncbi:hypothetical protein BD414DRAFT_575682 [Trametes punicea]|nr:hypothetical protein BD414DRAFT_575682 [Trametes punicea]
MSSHAVVVDDSDSSIEYVNIELGPYRGQGWTTRTGPTLDPKEGPIYNSTLHVTGIEDTSLVFPFKGTRVSVFGSVWPPTASWAPLTASAYSVLGWNHGNRSSMQPYQAPNVTSPRNNVSFYTSDIMTYDSYILTINVTTASGSSPYYLDYLVVEVPGPAPSSSPLTSASTSTSTSTSSLPLTSSFTPSQSSSSVVVGTSTPPPPLPAGHRRSARVGTIVGATIGGVAIIALAAVVIILALLRRRRLRSDFNYGPSGQQDYPSSPTPYVPPTSSGEMRESGRSISFSAAGASLESSSPILPSQPNHHMILPSQKALAAASAVRPVSEAVHSTASTSSNHDRKDSWGAFPNRHLSDGSTSSRPSFNERGNSATPLRQPDAPAEDDDADGLEADVEEYLPAYTPS